MGQSTPILKRGASFDNQGDNQGVDKGDFSLGASSADSWARIPIERIEDLADAVYGAGLQVTQMSREQVSGSLVFAEHEGALVSSGLINGRVELLGSLSTTDLTLGVGLKMPPNNRLWMHEVVSGVVGVFRAGDEHHALHFPGALYASVTLSEDRAEELAARAGVVLQPRKLGGSGIDGLPVTDVELHMLSEGFEALHHRRSDGRDLPGYLLDCMIQHFSRLPRTIAGAPEYRGHSRVVRRSVEYIHGNLHRKLGVEEIALATGTSSRTLFRAFHAILGEGPLAHVNRLRLHRIRQDLSNPEDHHSVTSIASRWGITELGRFAVAYNGLFGEKPSQTFARLHRHIEPNFSHVATQ